MGSTRLRASAFVVLFAALGACSGGAFDGGEPSGGGGGVAGGVGGEACTPGVYSCRGDELWGCDVKVGVEVLVETCGAGLCSPTSPACLVCAPGAVTGCAGPAARSICVASGARATTVACPAAAPLCVEGACVACRVDGDCQASSPCSTVACKAGACALSPLPAGPVGPQAQGDCRRVECDGAGAVVQVPDATDLPVEVGAECSVAACDGLVLELANAPVGTPCGPAKAGFCAKGGACGVCKPGSTRCTASGHEACGDDAQWGADPCAPGEVCSAGECAAVVQIAAGAKHTCATLDDGHVACWGSNEHGQLGDGSSGAGARASRPVFVPGLVGVTSLALGDRHTCAVVSSGPSIGGKVVCWGANDHGQLGLGPGAPELVATPAEVVGVDGVTRLALGTAATCALDALGAVRCWGDGQHAQTGAGAVGPDSPSPQVVKLAASSAIAAADRFFCALVAGSPACWGASGMGEIPWASGLVTAPMLNPVLADIASIALGARHGCVTGGDGATRCWGDNTLGQLGNEAALGASKGVVPTAFIVEPSALIAAGGEHTCQAYTQGVKCVGRNDAGQLGNGAFAPSKATLGPVVALVDGLLTPLGPAVALTAGARHTCAVGVDAVARCWGDGAEGQLGNGSYEMQNRAVSVQW